MPLIWPLLVALGLVLVHAALFAAEHALSKLHYTRFDANLLDQAKERPSVARLLEHINDYSRALRLGTLACTLGIGVALALFVQTLFPLLEGVEAEGALHFALWACGFFAALAIHAILGEWTPRAFGNRHAIRTLTVLSPLIRMARGLLAPVAFLLNAGGTFILGLFRLAPEESGSPLDVEVRIRSMLNNGAPVSPITERILKNALQLRNLVVQDVLIPRNRIQYFDLYAGAEANIEIARKSGHTRFPLCEGDLDQCIGLVHIKDLFRQERDLLHLDLKKFRRDIQRFSIDDHLDYVLEKLLFHKMHMALAVDEFGGAVGVITLEDVLEELVGDIHDEFDREENPIRLLPDGDYHIDGLAPIHDVAEALGIELSDEEVSTFGGLITSELGRMPRHQETFRMGRLQVTVTGVSEKRVINARARLVENEPGG